MQFTKDNIPICIKCEKNKALTLMNNMWVCGQCLHEFIQKQEAIKQKIFLEG